MTSRKNGDLVFECDDCGQYEEGLDPRRYMDEWEELKATKGWRCFPKEGGGWKHFCRDCVKEWGRNQRLQRPGAESNKQREAIGQARNAWRQRLQGGTARRQQPQPRPTSSQPTTRSPNRRRSDETPPWE